MTEKEFDEKWGHDVDVDKMSYEELVEFKNDCFEMYEEAGFIDKFDSPYEDESGHNGMGFDVVRRATAEEVDLEAMPVWQIKFDNGDIGYCYPEEITKVEHKHPR